WPPPRPGAARRERRSRLETATARWQRPSRCAVSCCYAGSRCYAGLPCRAVWRRCVPGQHGRCCARGGLFLRTPCRLPVAVRAGFSLACGGFLPLLWLPKVARSNHPPLGLLFSFSLEFADYSPFLTVMVQPASSVCSEFVTS